LQELAAGRSVAVVSDAGTPGISDPGHQIIRRAIEAGIAVVPIPGPAAFVNAVVASGLATDSMFFGGFLPSKKGDRRRRLAEVTNIPATLVFYESPHRLERSLSDCLEILGDRRAALAREITKIHEEFIRGRLSELIDKISHANLKGEFVLVIDRAAEAVIDSSDRPSLAERVAQLEAEGHERKAALKLAAKEFGMSKSEAYRLVQAEKK
jgi:16S rRNA (cytidine1402-2'-O)-methyltransferase